MRFNSAFLKIQPFVSFSPNDSFRSGAPNFAPHLKYSGAPTSTLANIVRVTNKFDLLDMVNIFVSSHFANENFLIKAGKYLLIH